MVIEPEDGTVKVAKCFDTYTSSQNLNAFIRSDLIPDGHIVVAACMDECVNNLSTQVMEWFAGMGSKDVWSLEYRQGFAFIGVQGNEALVNEKRGDLDHPEVSVTQVFKIKSNDSPPPVNTKRRPMPESSKQKLAAALSKYKKTSSGTGPGDEGIGVDDQWKSVHDT